VLSIRASDFMGVGALLREIQRTTLKGTEPHQRMSDAHAAFVLKNLARAARLFGGLEMPISAGMRPGEGSAGKTHAATHGGVRVDFGHLETTVRLELQERKLLAIEGRLAPLFETPLQDWGDVPDKFPSVVYDVTEAGKCLALGRDTAAVLHLMRVLERGLQ